MSCEKIGNGWRGEGGARGKVKRREKLYTYIYMCIYNV